MRRSWAAALQRRVDAALPRVIAWSAGSALLLAGCAGPDKSELAGSLLPPAAPGDRGLYATLVTNRGDIVIRLLKDEAPIAVENFVGLATGAKEWTHPESGRKHSLPLYNGTKFFRVIPGFVIQGGDPTNTGYGGPGFRFGDEFYPGRMFNREGLVGLANSGPNTNGSQFFITLASLPWLTGKHTIIGEVVEGLEVVRKIAAAARTKVDPQSGRQIDRPVKPQLLKSVRIEER
ncbi:MAG: peptidylprolyl isomerase [Elusimicrobiota bacterium]